MGTYIHAIVDHQVKDHRDRAAMVARLQPSIPVCTAIDDYWRSVSPNEPDGGIETWEPRREHPLANYLSYVGPAGLELMVSRRVAVVSGCRWRNFLTIEPLRNVELAAFRSLASCIRGSRLVLVADGTEIGYEAVDGLSQEECISQLQENYGPPQPSVEKITAEIMAEADRGVPMVWFVEAV